MRNSQLNRNVLYAVILLVGVVSTTNGFVAPSSLGRRTVDPDITTTPSTSSSSSSLSSSTRSVSRYDPNSTNGHHQTTTTMSEEEILQMKEEIASLRKEAEQRLKALTESLQVNTSSSPSSSVPDETIGAPVVSPRVASSTALGSSSSTTTPITSATTNHDDSTTGNKRYPEGVNENMEALLEQRIAKDRLEKAATTKKDDDRIMKKFPESEFEDSDSLLIKRMESDRAFLEQEKNKQRSSQQSSSTFTTCTTTPDLSVETKHTTATTPSTISTSKELDLDVVGSSLLENTRWRIMFNIGREPGTWMSKTWGASGERVMISLELEFLTAKTNHGIQADGDEFLGRDELLGTSLVFDQGLNSHVQPLRIIDGSATLAPNMKEGGRRNLRVKEMGAWRVAPGEGPMGTSVLRFYIELEEEIRHQGSDVYCPAGRIYCTCGYFPHLDKRSLGGMNRKDMIRKEQKELNAEYQQLVDEEESDDSFFMSFKKMKRGKKMMDLRAEANKLNHQMNVAQVQEPEKALLRLSQDQRVGLTREGGICCKVPKGLAYEYHILGKFEIASMTNREHTDYRELLP